MNPPKTTILQFQWLDQDEMESNSIAMLNSEKFHGPNITELTYTRILSSTKRDKKSVNKQGR